MGKFKINCLELIQELEKSNYSNDNGNLKEDRVFKELKKKIEIIHENTKEDGINIKILERIKNKFKRKKVKVYGRYYYKIKKGPNADCNDCAFRHDIWSCLESPSCEEYVFEEVE